MWNSSRKYFEILYLLNPKSKAIGAMKVKMHQFSVITKQCHSSTKDSHLGAMKVVYMSWYVPWQPVLQLHLNSSVERFIVPHGTCQANVWIAFGHLLSSKGMMSFATRKFLVNQSIIEDPISIAKMISSCVKEPATCCTLHLMHFVASCLVPTRVVIIGKHVFCWLLCFHIYSFVTEH